MKLIDTPLAEQQRKASLRYYYRNRALISERNQRPDQVKRRSDYWKIYRKTYLRPSPSRESVMKRKATSRLWVLANPKKISAIQQRHSQKSATKLRRARNMRRWRERPENAKKVAHWNKQWRESHQAQAKALSRKRQALKQGAAVDTAGIAAFIFEVRQKRSVRCYYCQCRRSGKTIHFDHIIALAKGGRHAVDNLCVSCPKCNLKKGVKPISDLDFLTQGLLCL